MNRTVPFLLSAGLILTNSAFAQTPAAPKSTTTAAHKPATATAAGPKLPPGVPVVHGVLRTAFSLRYEDFKIGTGKPAEPGKIYTVHYTGWLASDGKKFDSSFDHRRPVLDKDGKPENDADGKPKLGEAEPIKFAQGGRRLIPGWDEGFEGMKVGGKRRLFIPYQLAYGDAGRPPVIPAKSDLIFDIELVNVEDAPVSMPGGPRAPGAPGIGRPMPVRPGTPAPGAAPNNAPGTPAPPTGAPATQPTTPPPANAPVKPVDPTAPTTAPNSAPPPPTPNPTQPQPTNPTAPPDKPANPAQPQA
jgi:peptidylprolyl isomerase